MKRLLTITILWVPLLIHAQGLSIKSGIALSKWTGGVERPVENRTGISFGMSYGFHLSNDLTLNLGSRYLYTGSVQRFSESDEILGLTYNELIVVKTKNLNLPVLIKYLLNDNVYLQGGPYVSFLLSDEIEATYTQCIEGNCIGERETFESNDVFESNTLGIEIGIGTLISDSFIIEVSLLKGLSPTIDQKDPIKDQSLMFSFGYQF